MTTTTKRMRPSLDIEAVKCEGEWQVRVGDVDVADTSFKALRGTVQKRVKAAVDDAWVIPFTWVDLDGSAFTVSLASASTICITTSRLGSWTGSCALLPRRSEWDAELWRYIVKYESTKLSKLFETLANFSTSDRIVTVGTTTIDGVGMTVGVDLAGGPSRTVVGVVTMEEPDHGPATTGHLMEVLAAHPSSSIVVVPTDGSGSSFCQLPWSGDSLASQGFFLPGCGEVADDEIEGGQPCVVLWPTVL